MSSRLDLMASKVAQSVVGGRLVQIVERGEIKHLADDIVKVLLLFDEDHAVMDELGGDVADDVHSQHSEVIFAEYKLEESRFCS